jgi:hypothetical protein
LLLHLEASTFIFISEELIEKKHSIGFKRHDSELSATMIETWKLCTEAAAYGVYSKVETERPDHENFGLFIATRVPAQSIQSHQVGSVLGFTTEMGTIRLATEF